MKNACLWNWRGNGQPYTYTRYANPTFGHLTIVGSGQVGIKISPHSLCAANSITSHNVPLKCHLIWLIYLRFPWHCSLLLGEDECSFVRKCKVIDFVNSTLSLALLTLTRGTCLHVHLCPPCSSPCSVHGRDPVNICWIHLAFEQIPSHPYLIPRTFKTNKEYGQISGGNSNEFIPQ